MSTSRNVTVWCDGKTPDGHDCPAWVMGDGTAVAARREAARHGWRVGLPGGRDLCRDHKDKKGAENG